MGEKGTPRDLRELIALLRRRGELVEVHAAVDPCLELAEIHRRVAAADGPALLFSNVASSAMSVVTNLFGTRERAALAFGPEGPERVARLVEAVRSGGAPGFGWAWRHRRALQPLLRLGSRTVRRAPVLAVEDREPDLTQLPALTGWPEDGGPFLTLPLVLTESPSGKGPNLGIYRMQIHGPRLAGMHWQIGKGGGAHHVEAESRGEALPVTVMLGGPPALIVSAITPLPENVPELLLASFLLGRRLRVAAIPDWPHRVAADAELAILGHVPPGVRRPEGPFGDHYGYYSLRHDYPVLEVERIVRRKDAIFPATVVGKPRQEDFFIGEMLQELLAPLFPVVMPAVEALWSYGETGFHALAAAVVRERYAREALAAAFRILGEGQLALTKFLLVTDAPVDPRAFRPTLEAVLERTDLSRDLHVVPETAMDTLDYAGPEVNRGSKGVLIGVGPPRRQLPGGLEGVTLPSGFGPARVFCRGCAVVSGPPWEQEPGAAKRLAGSGALAEWPLVVLVDDAGAATASETAFLWTAFTRFDPARDLVAASARLEGNAIVREGPVVLDARMKPWYPAVVECDPETARTVERRWNEYFPEGGVAMGDSSTAHLDRAP